MKQPIVVDVAEGHGCIEFYDHMIMFYFPNEDSKKVGYDELWMMVRENEEV